MSRAQPRLASRHAASAPWLWLAARSTLVEQGRWRVSCAAPLRVSSRRVSSVAGGALYTVRARAVAGEERSAGAVGGQGERGAARREPRRERQRTVSATERKQGTPFNAVLPKRKCEHPTVRSFTEARRVRSQCAADVPSRSLYS